MMEFEEPSMAKNKDAEAIVGPTGLTRQPSNAADKAAGSCLCSPTTHVGSFRCRLHRAPSLQRTKSLDLGASSIKDQHSSTPMASSSSTTPTTPTATYQQNN